MYSIIKLPFLIDSAASAPQPQCSVWGEIKHYFVEPYRGPQYIKCNQEYIINFTWRKQKVDFILLKHTISHLYNFDLLLLAKRSVWAIFWAMASLWAAYALTPIRLFMSQIWLRYPWNFQFKCIEFSLEQWGLT